jgi:diguanylate cyclase (GGDEF)-like protein
MSDGLVVFDENGKIAYCNPQYTALFPKTAELRTPGHALVDIVRAGIRCGEEIVPSGMDEATWVESARTSLRTPGSRLLHMADGRWLQVRIRPGKDGGALALVSDISAMKNAEDKLIQMNARLEALASTDSLTGLQNRRSFDDALAREFTRNARSDTPLSVLIVDVDRFKAYNDAYGHPQGDECLKEVAAVLTMAVHRPADIVARYGGEEFVVLLPETNDEGAWSRAEKIRNAVRDLNIAHRGSDKGRVTVTIGIAVRAGGDVSPSDLIRRADAALYAGKTSGRDQTRGPHGGEDPRRRLAG